jgi:tetratricopeptide (TPR) repeat protein
MEGDFDRAMVLAGEGATIARVIGDQRVLADALVYQGLVQQYAGDYEQASRRFQESLPIARSFGDRHLIGMTLSLLGQLAVRHGNFDDARRYLAEGLRLAREVGNVRRLSLSLSAVASLAFARGEPSLGLRFEGAARAAAQSVGTARAQPAQVAVDAEMAAARAEVGEVAGRAAFEAGRQLTLDHAVDEALKWLGDDALERLDEAELARWQSSPWTVFGWVGSPGAVGPAMRLPNSGAARSVGGVRAYGEGGVESDR